MVGVATRPAGMTGRQVGRIAAVRRFNRFYTRCIGALDDGLLQSEFSLTEVRVLFELAHGQPTTAGTLGQRLGLDAGYLSRILQRFRRNGLLLREPSPHDRREYHLRLTSLGRTTFAPLDRAASREVAQLLRPLVEGEQRDLLSAMQTIMRILDGGRPD
ncbi:MAG: MarR family winged helix-turn-helix transcriptional regulator [Ferrovibrio sp.]|uniref:MarR family winged helix-turn-helix transcriptional regulator n=1 Tax=Ferrovibrio sp. TaxID=1917215 RepID=UPI002613951B|nr:MarR family winged helix-turn-helix transcriptional regulator [Ferrovibrio sp.]MCW0232527.1 MarR family winged helix-turn-helix transcriptional regulator [Ferrovibrio sp.]